MYGLTASDTFPIDELLDFSNEELFSSTDYGHHPHPLEQSTSTAVSLHSHDPNSSTDFTDDLRIPTDDVAELEWLSNFVEDSFTDIPAVGISGTVNLKYESPFHGRTQSKRTRLTAANSMWTSLPESDTAGIGKSQTKSTGSRSSSSDKKKEISSSTTSRIRRCTHCAAEQTPQWRTGPMGPKTLCNACGVRYKSGRLVPEYRPAASPTFVLTQHSNSHRKVMELRRQKETIMQQLQLYSHPHHHDFKVC